MLCTLSSLTHYACSIAFYIPISRHAIRDNDDEDDDDDADDDEDDNDGYFIDLAASM